MKDERSSVRPMKLREWLTIPDAAHYLTEVFAGDVRGSDVLRYGLDGQLKLSVQFVNLARAKRHIDPSLGYQEMWEQSTAIQAAKAAGQPEPVFEVRPLTPAEEECRIVVTLREPVYDLPLVGGERLDVEREYQRLSEGPKVELTASEGTFVESKDGRRFQLLVEKSRPNDPDLLPHYLEPHIEPYRSGDPMDRCTAASQLPDGSVLVVRTAALAEFIARTLLPAPDAHPPDATTHPKDTSIHNVSVQSRSSLPATERCPATWQDVRLEFISDHSVQVTVNAKTYPKNYAEMGFADRRKGTPTLAWQILRRLAESDGTISKTAPKDWSKMEKRMQEIRRTLHAHFFRESFDIPPDSDPLPFLKEGKTSGYHAVFRIGTRPSYDT
jgi:hypothetical protein